MLKSYLVLLMAIVFETVATSFLKQSEQFTKFWPSVVTVAGYAAAFYCLSLVLKHIPVGIAYAIWSGVGIVLIAVSVSRCSNSILTGRPCWGWL